MLQEQRIKRSIPHPTYGAPHASSTRIVGGAGTVVYVYDADSEELLKQLEGTSHVTSVAVFEDEQGGLITAGYEDGTIKVWDLGALQPSYRPSLAKTDA